MSLIPVVASYGNDTNAVEIPDPEKYKEVPFLENSNIYEPWFTGNAILQSSAQILVKFPFFTKFVQ